MRPLVGRAFIGKTNTGRENTCSSYEKEKSEQSLLLNAHNLLTLISTRAE
ncbi:hypothetical protein HMPREF3208_00546 [Gardnerella vaginalis]|uniref:Uncharacterized protein n=1 Tax=Gardnerella vaginalis TaxID=2702 RepID=A0A133NYW6_GARVA|nr:hypothetical protein HMPREF3208_00546 [Gardnerella vaginalis]